MAADGLHHGDCAEVLPTLEANSVDAVVTDPPYGLSFMGRRWDYDMPATAVWREVLRVLKPGGHLLSFGGTRTYHRMVVNIEDAGFEIRDQIAWLFGSGFPKSRNLTDAWQGWGSAIKPAHEPVCVARKPLIGTLAANVLAWGTGALNIDGCRVEGPMDGVWGTSNATVNRERKFNASPAMGEYRSRPHLAGRWPANVAHDGSPEVLALFPAAPGQIARAATGQDRRKDQNCYGAMMRGPNGAAPRSETDKSAARFFYCAKASRRDRDEGLESGPARNGHPTVKPTALMRWLCRLVTPPGGLALDPWMGSGSTGKACILEGFRFIGIEREAEYIAIARARIAAARAVCTKWTPRGVNDNDDPGHGG